MSILNALVERDWARVEVDTIGEVTSLDSSTVAIQMGDRIHVPKMVAIPHLGAVLAGRGNADFFACAVAGVLMRMHQSLDALAEHLPELLDELFSYHQTTMRTASMAPPSEEQDFLLAGWSSCLNRMIGINCWRTERDPRFQAIDIAKGGGKVSISPWFEDLEPFEQMRGEPDEFAQVAQMQLRWVAADPSRGAAGGRRIAAVLSPRGIELQTATDLPVSAYDRLDIQ